MTIRPKNERISAEKQRRTSRLGRMIRKRVTEQSQKTRNQCQKTWSQYQPPLASGRRPNRSRPEIVRQEHSASTDHRPLRIFSKNKERKKNCYCDRGRPPVLLQGQARGRGAGESLFVYGKIERKGVILAVYLYLQGKLGKFLGRLDTFYNGDERGLPSNIASFTCQVSNLSSSFTGETR